MAAATVDSLPDEILALIFSMLSPRARLDTTPLVCKRWREVTRLPESWRTFSLTLPFDTSKERWIELARLAKVAPWVHCLDLSRVYMYFEPKISQIVKALLDGNKSVKTLRTAVGASAELQEFNRLIIRKFAPSLRKVSIYTYRYLDQSIYEEFASYHKCIDNLLEQVADIPHLLSLELDLALCNSCGGREIDRLSRHIKKLIESTSIDCITNLCFHGGYYFCNIHKAWFRVSSRGEDIKATHIEDNQIPNDVISYMARNIMRVHNKIRDMSECNNHDLFNSIVSYERCPLNFKRSHTRELKWILNLKFDRNKTYS